MYFIEFNNNPKNNRTGDCLIRALSFASDKKWEDVYSELAVLGIENALMINDKSNYETYLKQLGFEKQEKPRRRDNTKYTIEEFSEEIAECNKIYIIQILGHMTVIKNKILYDTTNCEQSLVENVWTK